MGKKNKIVFTNTMPDLVSDKYSPKPAIKFIPEWYKKMESYIPETVKPDSTPTIKKCIPVLDVMTAGYIIVSPFDIYVSVIDGEIVYKYPGPAQYKMIEGHPRKQGYLHPNAMEHPFPKWINPWGIKTPKGYSTLFIPPAHNPNPWFVALEGFVDTDTYSAPVNFPFILKNPGTEFLIPAGTPIVQAIPVKRDDWISELSNDNTSANESTKFLSANFFDRYKKKFWERKSYA